MEDASKITVNGVTYNVKDTTARDAASAAQTTANGKLSDALSDGKEYLRKNGEWVEPSGGGGPSLPTGGTIGQVLAKRSNTDGDAGWYTPGQYPTDKWYLADGVTENMVTAAYQFINRESEAEALININDGTKYNLSKTHTSVTWDSTNGIFFPASVDAPQGLTNDVLNADTPIMFYCVIAGFKATNTGDGRQKLSITNSRHGRRILQPVFDGNANMMAMNNGESIGAQTSFCYTAENTRFYNGVAGGNWDSVSQVFRNGVQMSTSNTVGNWSAADRYNCFIGTVYAGEIPHYITAIAFYNTFLTPAQHLQISNNIHALGGLNL